MTYTSGRRHSDEGFSVSVPGLPGCWSQGDTEKEALEKIEGAIREYLAARDESPQRRNRILTVPRHNPVNASTMGGIIRDVGLTANACRALR